MRRRWELGVVSVSLVAASVALVGCQDNTRYAGSDAVVNAGDDGAADGVNNSVGGMDDDVPARPPVGIVPGVEGRCGLVPALSAEGLDDAHDVVRQWASLEEVTDENGALVQRTMRWFEPPEAVVRAQVEYVAGEDCLGVRVVTVSDAQGRPLESRTEIYDPNTPVLINTFVPLEQHSIKWSYNEEGQEVLVEVDMGIDGEVEHVTRSTWDGQGRLVARSAEPVAQTDTQSMWHLNDSTSERWVYGDGGEVTHTSMVTHGMSFFTTITETRHNANGDLVHREVVSDGVRTSLEERTWRGPGLPLTHEVWHQNSRQTFARWFYDNSQTHAVRMESEEDFNGDGVLDRAEETWFDAQGRVVLFEQDQPFDGVVDWQEETVWGEGEQKLRETARTGRGGPLYSEIVWTLDDQGRVVEVQGRSLAGGFTNHEALSYDAQGRLIETISTRTANNSRTRRIHQTLYDDEAQSVVNRWDNDDDGAWDSTTLVRFDRAGNVIEHLDHHPAGAMPGRTTRLNYGTFEFLD